MEVTQNKEQNLISSDPMVAGIFRAVRAENGEPIEKLKAVIRGGKIAEAYSSGGLAYETVCEALGEVQ